MAQNEMNGLMFKMQDDPRITKVGKFIRKTSIDELPQFFDVLRGDMSLVGTRPPTLDEYKQYESHHKRRLSMKPGITGLWQVSGRSDIEDFEDVVKLDVQYIDNWSLWGDIKILFKTVWVVFAGRGQSKSLNAWNGNLKYKNINPEPILSNTISGAGNCSTFYNKNAGGTLIMAATQNRDMGSGSIPKLLAQLALPARGGGAGGKPAV